LNILFLNSRYGFGIDAGYRSFFNVVNNIDDYKDGWFAKLIYMATGPGVRFSLYASFDTRYYPLPKFGTESYLKLLGVQEAVIMEFGFPDGYFEFTLGGRIYMDLGAFTGN
jgi:hypothetical protein